MFVVQHSSDTNFVETNLMGRIHTRLTDKLSEGSLLVGLCCLALGYVVHGQTRSSVLQVLQEQTHQYEQINRLENDETKLEGRLNQMVAVQEKVDLAMGARVEALESAMKFGIASLIANLLAHLFQLGIVPRRRNKPETEQN
jgi:hypothetical protein